MSTEGFRLSPQQRRLWTLHRAGETCLGAALRVSLRGDLDPALLDRALEVVVRKHEILRTTFRPDGALASQRVGEDSTIVVVDEDLRAANASEQEARIGDVLAGARSFDPENGPLFRIARLRRGDAHHELVITGSALCADSASLDQLVGELARAYASLSGGSPFDDEAMQYADVAEWQNELLEAEDSRAGRTFWRQRELVPDSDLPFQSPATRSGIGVHEVDLALAGAVAAAAARTGVSTRDFLLGAWVALLSRLGGEPGVLVGVCADGRRHEELEDALGPLERYLPLSLTVDDGTSFSDVAGAVSRELEDTLKWQECFAWDGLDDGYRFGFAYGTARPLLEGGGVRFEIEGRRAHSERIACRLACEERGDRVLATFEYDEGALGAPTVARLAEELESLLADALARPAAELRDLDSLGATERRAHLVDLNATDADYPRGVCPHQWIEEHAARTPDSVAVRQGDRALTYGELDLRANRLAHHLQGLGVGPDDLVGLCIERSFEMVVGILGILKAGGAYVPVDPAYPAERLQFLLEDTRAAVLLTQRSMLDRLPETGAVVVCIDSDDDAIARHPTTAPELRATPANLVYVIYTSGSTGKPKGVVITHEKLAISNTARVNYFGHTPEAFLLLSSVAFDSSVVGLFWTLCGGGTLVLIPEGEQKDLPRIPEVIAEEGVTHLLTLPSFYRLILEQSRPQDLAGLSTVIVAGEACPLKMVRHHMDALPGVGLFSEYGATETTVFSSVYDCLEQTLPIAPVGAPIDNAEMYVLDEELRPCPTGVPGEVHFGGIALALGYWRRPSLTAERFVPHPFSDRPGERLYKSGDLARHLENGDIEFLGRIDNQVKIRGYRIELEEIEIALAAHPALKETAVLARGDHGEEKRLVGYVVTEAGATTPTVGELRDFLLQSLPDFMAPAIFVFLDDFPRTPNGKVDRKALPEPGSERPELDMEFRAPSTPAEETLASIWADVLGLEQVGVNDNFFELGGDSILSIQIVSRAKQQGLELTPRQVFENQTVAELARAAGEVAALPAVVAEQGRVTGEVPLTPVQQWFFELDLPEPDHWNMPLLLELRRRVDPEVLAGALRSLTEHHDMLRARFARTPSGWQQEISASEVDVSVAREDLSGIAETDLDSALGDRAARHHAALDLAQGALVNAVLFELGAGRPQRLLLIVHHLVVDGVSWRILLEDLETALEQLERGDPVRLPRKTTSYQHWAGALADYAAAPERERELGPWAGAADWNFTPHDGSNREESARIVSVVLDEEETRSLLTRVPKAYNTQINDVLVTALVHALAEWTGTDSQLLNLEGHGREEVGDGIDLTRTVGWFTTDYPVRLVDTSPFEPGAALRSMKEQLRAIEGFAFGVGRYLGESAGARALRAIPRPTIGFNYLGQFDQVLGEDARFRLVDGASGPSMSPAGERVFALEAYGLVSNGRLRMDFEYGSELWDRATVETVAQGFLTTLRELIGHCVSPDAGGFTASDFGDFSWSDSDLSNIASAIQKTQDDGSEEAS